MSPESYVMRQDDPRKELLAFFVVAGIFFPIPAQSEPSLDWTFGANTYSTFFFNEVKGLEEPSNTLAFSARANLKFDAFGGKHRVILDGNRVYEDETTTRSGSYLNEGYWFGEFDNFDITLGKVKENWGVIESRDLVNNITPVDILSEYSSSDRFPQDMFKVGIPFTKSRLDFYLLGDIETRQFQQTPTRFLTDVVVGPPIFSEAAKSDDLDFALRYGLYTNSLELTSSYFEGKNRTPQIIPIGSENRPFYNRIKQYGLEALLIDDQLIYRFEAVNIEGDGFEDDFIGATVGAEYTLNSAFGNADLVFTGEYHWDEKEKNSSMVSQRNYFDLGILTSLNDKYLSTLKFSGSVLLSDPSHYLLNLEADIGLTDNLRMEIGFFNAGRETAMLSGFTDDKPLRFVKIGLGYTF